MFTNLSFYMIDPISHPQKLAEDIQSLGNACGILGTILIAEEGVNANTCGTEQQSFVFLEGLKAIDARFSSLWIKKSTGDIPSFQRFESRHEPDVLSFESPLNLSVDDIQSGGRISADDFKKAVLNLDQEPDTVIIDTRNEYEIDYGKFKNAISFDIRHFRDFIPKFLERFGEQKNKTYLMYCTGGIRCEKATAALNKLGFAHAKQLDGGILGYFESAGDAGYEGNCFVFDHRWAVTPELAQSADGPHPSQIPKPSSKG